MAQPKKYSFVTSTDDLGGFKDASVQRLVRQHAMWETSRARKLNPEWSKNICFQASTAIADNADQRANQDPTSNDNASAVPKAALKRARGRNRVNYSNSSEDRTHRTAEHTPRITTPALVGSPQHTLEISRLGSARLDPFETYPVVLDSFKERVIHDMFDPTFRNGPWANYTDFTYRMSFQHPAALHELVSFFISCITITYPEKQIYDNSLPLKYHALALKSVKESLHTQEAVDNDGFLVAIVSLGAFSYMTTDVAGWKMHSQAQKEIIRLRGGFEKLLSSNSDLGVLLHNNDVAFAFLQDIPCQWPPLRSVPTVSEEDQRTWKTQSPVAKQMSQVWQRRFPNQPLVSKALDELVYIKMHLTPEGDRKQNCPWTIHTQDTRLWTNVVVYDLLQAHRDGIMDADGGYVMQEAFRLAAMLYIYETKFYPDGLFFLVPNLPARLRIVLAGHPGADWAELWPLKLWILSIAAISSEPDPPERAWFVDQLAQCLDLQVPEYWPWVSQLLRDILWIEEIYAEKAKSLHADLEALKSSSGKQRTKQEAHDREDDAALSELHSVEGQRATMVEQMIFHDGELSHRPKRRKRPTG